MPTTTELELLSLDPSSIFVDKTIRQRQEMGDVDGLAESIKAFGQLQPILVERREDGSLALVAGGRRLEACKKLRINVFAVVDGLQSEDQRLFHELEENVRRKDITWQEKTCATAAIHKKCLAKNILLGEKWLPVYTGQLVGVSQASVYNALKVAEQLEKGDEEIMKCGGVREAIQILAKRAERKATQLLVTASSPPPSDGGFDTPGDAAIATTSVEFNAPKRARRKLEIVHGDAIKWLGKQADKSLTCIYCDPPYAIDMDNIQQEGGGMNIEDVRDTHDVKENLDLLTRLIPVVAAKLVQGNGFFAMWCDTWHFRDIARICDACGLNVQRWPFVWVKTHRCQNMAAMYNFTKNIEVCLIARTHKSLLVAPQGDCTFIGENDKPDWVSNPFWKPLPLHQRILSAIATPGTRIIDLFGGCGSIGLAATEAHWDCLMVEKDATHIAALQRYLKE